MRSMVAKAGWCAAAAALCLGLGACSNSSWDFDRSMAGLGNTLGKPVQPSAPKPGSVVAYYNSLSMIMGTADEPSDGTAKKTTIKFSNYVLAGYAQVDAECEVFFEALYEARSTEKFIRSETILGLGTASAAIAIASKAAKTLAYIALGTAAVSASFDNFEAWSYLSLYQASLKTHVNQAMTQIRLKNTPDSAKDPVTADSYVKTYAYQCTPMEMDLFINNALTATTPKVQTVGPLTGVEAEITNAFNLTGALTTDNVNTLYGLLTNTDPAKRTAAGSPPPPFNTATNGLWDANGKLTPLGNRVANELTTIQSAYKTFDAAAAVQGVTSVTGAAAAN